MTKTASTRSTTLAVAICLGMFGYHSGVLSQSLPENATGVLPEETTLSTVEQGLPTITVYVETLRTNRKSEAAEKVTAMNEEMAKTGWTVLDVTIYIEDGDQEGFFITYIKYKSEWSIENSQ